MLFADRKDRCGVAYVSYENDSGGEWSQCLVCSAESEDRSVSVLQCLSGIDRTGDREDVSR